MPAPTIFQCIINFPVDIISHRSLFSTIIFITIYSLEFFTLATSDSLSLEIEWQQVSSNLHDSSQYSDRFQ